MNAMKIPNTSRLFFFLAKQINSKIYKKKTTKRE